MQIGHIRIPGIGLELACKWGWCGGVFSNTMIFPRMSLHSKLVPVQYREYEYGLLHIVILDYDWLKDNREFSKPMISRKMMKTILCRNFEESFPRTREKWLEERSSGTSPMKLHSPKRLALWNVNFLDNSLVQINFKLNSKEQDLKWNCWKHFSVRTLVSKPYFAVYKKVSTSCIPY